MSITRKNVATNAGAVLEVWGSMLTGMVPEGIDERAMALDVWKYVQSNAGLRGNLESALRKRGASLNWRVVRSSAGVSTFLNLKVAGHEI